MSSGIGSRTTVNARQFIEKIASNRLHVFKSTIDPATGEYLDDPYAQNKSAVEQVAADYRGRFLIELIQNGNDAHPRERRDGEIEVLLADEGPCGTIYVANKGSPFSEERAHALSRIGKSSKPPGEAIGNKGLGFRSVIHVCRLRPKSTPKPTHRSRARDLAASALRWSTGAHSTVTLMSRAPAS